MNRLFEIDIKDYKETDKVFRRPSARAIIVRGDKLALVYSRKEKYYKFPGGGIHDDEDKKQALAREVREEAGMVVIPESIKEFGSVLRRQKSDKDENTIFEQENYYYFCDVEDELVDQDLDAYEDEAGFELRIVDIDTAIEANDIYTSDVYFNEVMIKRELRVLRMLKTVIEAGHEVWDLYDRDGNRTGETFVRGFGQFKNIPDGRYHLVVDLLVLHEDGTYLLMKRSECKDVYPGYWEASAGGSALSGEDPLEAAGRELLEETGLTADSLELVNILFKDTSHAMFYSYLARVSGDKDRIILQEGETTDHKWLDKQQFLAHVDSEDAMKSHNQRFEKYISTLR